MLKTALIASTFLFAGGAYADEVVIHRDAPEVVAPAASSTTTVEKHGVGCDSKSVHAENDAGDSKTVTHTDCD